MASKKIVSCTRSQENHGGTHREYQTGKDEASIFHIYVRLKACRDQHHADGEQCQGRIAFPHWTFMLMQRIIEATGQYVGHYGGSRGAHKRQHEAQVAHTESNQIRESKKVYGDGRVPHSVKAVDGFCPPLMYLNRFMIDCLAGLHCSGYSNTDTNIRAAVVNEISAIVHHIVLRQTIYNSK